jgi:hypothetical protein
MWQFDVHRTFVYWEIWFGYTLLHMLLFFFTDTPNKEVGQHKLDAKYRKTHLEMTKKKRKKKKIKFIKGNPVRIRPFILIKRRFVMTLFVSSK